MESEGLDEDAVMMQALDAGAEDFLVEEGVFEIYTAPDDFSTVREALEKEGYTFAQAELQMVPQNYITLEKEEDMAQMRSCSTTSRITTMCRPFGTTGRMRMITRVNAPVKTA